VLPTVLHCPETRRWTLTGTVAAQSVNPSLTLTIPRATKDFTKRNVTLLDEVMGGQWLSGGGTWNAVSLRTAPSLMTSLNVLTRIGPSAASDGTSTLSEVGASTLGTVCVAVAVYGAKRASPPTASVVDVPEDLRRFLPVIVTVVPADPAQGVNEVMVGEQAPGLVLVKSVGLVAVSLALVTWIVPPVVPATVAQILVAETTLNAVTGVPPISTLVTAGLSKFVPVITTTQPAGPLVGENELMLGETANAGASRRSTTKAAATPMPAPRRPRCRLNGVMASSSRPANEMHSAPPALSRARCLPKLCTGDNDGRTRRLPQRHEGGAAGAECEPDGG
jgi:hypothetical protein